MKNPENKSTWPTNGCEIAMTMMIKYAEEQSKNNEEQRNKLMRHYLKKRYILVLYCFLLNQAITEAQNSDFGIWTTLCAEKDLGKLNVSAENELRTNNMSGQICRWSMGTDVSYRLIKHINAGAGYRFMRCYDSRYSDFQPRHRVYIYLQGKYRVGNFTFSLRERLQRTNKDESDRIKNNGEINTYLINPDVVWRNRLKMAYNIPKFPVNPAISVESFYQLNNPEGNSFEQLRYVLSLNYSPLKHHKFEAYGLLDDEININSPERMFVAGFNYTFSF